MRFGWLVPLLLLTAPLAGVVSAQTTSDQPHVIVGVPDSGINPYHEEFYRPSLTDHPCTYIQDFPCEAVEKLDLSIQEVHEQGLTYSEAIDRDQAEIEDLEFGQLYWIPQTPFVAVMCTDYGGSAVQDTSDTCILDDGTSHGTATTSSVIRENPDALIAFKQGGSSVFPLLDKGIPVDIASVSWGTVAPIPLSQFVPQTPLYVKAAGNDPRSTLVDGWSGNPDVIAVGGAYPDRGPTGRFGQEASAANQVDVVAWYCREVAAPGSITAETSACGTSFSAPTVAGALSKVILEIRQDSGYTGTITSDGLVDADSEITKQELRDAMNRTATYNPTERDPPRRSTVGIPVQTRAPWVQWGWGWYDSQTAETTADHLLGTENAPAKSELAHLYMESVYEGREILY